MGRVWEVVEMMGLEVGLELSKVSVVVGIMGLKVWLKKSRV